MIAKSRTIEIFAIYVSDRCHRRSVSSPAQFRVNLRGDWFKDLTVTGLPMGSTMVCTLSSAANCSVLYQAGVISISNSTRNIDHWMLWICCNSLRENLRIPSTECSTVRLSLIKWSIVDIEWSIVHQTIFLALLDVIKRCISPSQTPSQF